MTSAQHTHPSLAHQAACPVCNPDKTVPALNEAFRSKDPSLCSECGWDFVVCECGEDIDDEDDCCEHGAGFDEDCDECDFDTDPMGLP